MIEARSDGRRAVGLVVGACLLAVGLACTTHRLRPEDLPDRPIAFLHWSDREAQKRQELFEKMSEVPPLPRDAPDAATLQALAIRAHLRGDEMLQLRSKLEEHPGRLMLLWPRTGEMERISAAPIDSIPLSWSPDGEKLLIASAHRGDEEHLYEFHLGRRDLRPVTRGAEEYPRGDYDRTGRILAQRTANRRGQETPTYGVHRLDLTGRPGPLLALDVPPGTVHVFPEGDRIVYEQVVVRPRRDGPALFDSFVAVQALARGAGEDLLLRGREPTLTPDGQWIVFASKSAAGYRLRRMRPDGTSRVPIGPGGTEERMPSVSPDGRFVAFVQFDLGRRRLAVRRFDGSDERVIVSGGWSEFPVW
jgi:hypothetical protein